MKRKRGTTRDMMVTPAPPTWEVIREHPATCRVQLHAWDLGEAAAIKEAAIQGCTYETMASSGKLERGWRYVARPSKGGP
jgi:hypothetical protein